MIERRRFNQQLSLQDRLVSFAKTALELAALLPPGTEKDELLRKAQRADTSARAQQKLRAAARPAAQSKSMRDYQASVKKLRNEAPEAALIRDLATAPVKRETFGRIHEHLNRRADEVELAMSEPKTA